MPARREPSHPPSDPHPPRMASRASGLDLGNDDRPGRLQLGAALLLGLVLVASGLYMWRRPRSHDTDAQADDTSAAAPSAAAAVGDAGAMPGAIGAFSVDAGAASGVAITEPRVLACQDKGSKRTAPDACDRLAPVEKALADAINQAATCVQAGAGAGGGTGSGNGGTIEYVADVSFSRHKVGVSLPRAGRSVHDKKALRSCASAVRSALAGMALDSVDHQHARYKIAVTATYKGSAAGGTGG